MKRFVAILMAAICVCSLTACGSKKPNLDEVMQAIEAGTLTVEDAVAKGYVTQEWADDYIGQNSVPAGSKVDAGAVAGFETTTLDGAAFTQADMGDVTFFSFVDPTDPDCAAFYQAMADAYDGVKKAGAEIVMVVKNGENTDAFADAPFPVILYNDSLKEAVGMYADMIEELPNAGSWYMKGSFLSSWASMVDREDLVQSAADFVGMLDEFFPAEETGEGEAAGMVGMQ